MSKNDDRWIENEAVHRAASDGDIKELEQLIRSGYSIHQFDDLGQTPLHYAVQNQHYKVAQFLLEHGADVNARHLETNSNTPIALAVEGDYPEMVTLLLSFGADPTMTGWMGLNACDRAEKNKTDSGEEIRKILRAVKLSN
jgi:ankyrin repeat protein